MYLLWRSQLREPLYSGNKNGRMHFWISAPKEPKFLLQKMVLRGILKTEKTSPLHAVDSAFYKKFTRICRKGVPHNGKSDTPMNANPPGTLNPGVQFDASGTIEKRPLPAAGRTE